MKRRIFDQASATAILDYESTMIAALSDAAHFSPSHLDVARVNLLGPRTRVGREDSSALSTPNATHPLRYPIASTR